MNISAYVCLGDPAWLEASIMSYYPYVTKIIASYDQDNLSWSGPEISVNQCINRLRSIDIDNKVIFLPGKFSREEYYQEPIQNETYQRQVSLDYASRFGDWVIQLDTDEIISNWPVFVSFIHAAIESGSESVYFPAIYIYQMVTNELGLEMCHRFGRRQAGYPAPLAVQANTKVTYARRVSCPTLHVKCERSINTLIDPNASISPLSVAAKDCVVHITRGRTPEYMKRKLSTWGHSRDQDFTKDMQYWTSVRKFPWLYLFLSHCLRGAEVTKFRLYKLPVSVRKYMKQLDIDGEPLR